LFLSRHILKVMDFDTLLELGPEALDAAWTSTRWTVTLWRMRPL
jgi:hypothetical protein